tara:strand:+ start:533 stop:1390 length:858 start_codon:yes stop_codon:yes gene_type:complete
MITSYLEQIEVMEMISRRLTKTQKAEILEAYRDGANTNVLAEKFSCTANTINRTVKTLLTETEYVLLKEKRSKINNKKIKLSNNEIVKDKKEGLDKLNSLNSLKENDKAKVLSIQEIDIFDSNNVDEIVSFAVESDSNQDLPSEIQDKKNNEIDKNNQKFDSDFEVIAPLISSFDFDQEKQESGFEILDYESLPESVYMIVDKKVELDLQLISDLPEWSFLPEKELERNAILLFLNQRSAKRNCSRNQRVIKIPNTSVFKLSKQYLISKGITRLILEDSLFAIDN